MSNILAISLRKTDELSLKAPIESYIERSYDQHPAMFKADITQLDQIRHAVVVCELRQSSVEHLLRYFAQLTFMAVKFPSDIKVGFTWYGTLSYATVPVTRSDLQFERANVLYNLGALHSALGLEQNRANADGLKRAALHFQIAAGCFAYLKANVLVELHDTPPDDLSAATMDVLVRLMLAQAQECFWQKAVLDVLKNSTIARLANQVSEYYAQASEAALRAPAIRSEWLYHLSCKKHHFEAAAQYRASADCLAGHKYGQELARLQAALDACVLALADAKHVAKPVKDDLLGLQTRLKSDFARAEKDNDMIYLAHVPALSELAPLKSASTVSPVVPVEVEHAMDASHDKYAPPLFSKLVPFAAHIAASIYVDRRDTIVNNMIIAPLDGLTVQLHDFLTRLGLPGSLQALERPVGLPPSVVDQIEQVRASGGYNAMQASVADVRELAGIGQAVYDAVVDLLDTERREDDDMRARVGTDRWRRLPSAEAAAQLYERLRALGGVIRQAGESDEIVRAKFREYDSTFRLLSADVSEIERQLPAADVSTSTGPDHDMLETRTAELSEKMSDVSKVEYRRRKLVEDVKELARTDDVTELVLQETARLERADPFGKIEPTQFEKLFTDRLRKYDDAKQAVEREHDEQTTLMTEVELASNDFQAALARTRTGPTAREQALQGLQDGYFKYQQLMANLDEGRKFYNELMGPLTKLQDECTDFVYSRRVEAHDQQRTDSPLPAPRAQGPPARVLDVWTPERGIRFD
ncbi:BRO1-like domain-containing protein [Lipomyces arxii]|uniref:BRO1-like domain-containing protein n=1 Tax=Lipomyces arxii TaxID=56418 RepID=UPI0034CDDD90